MSKKKIQVQLLKDGTIKTKTIGYTGKQCLKSAVLIESLTEARIIDSDFLPEYYQQETIVEEAYSQLAKLEVQQ